MKNSLSRKTPKRLFKKKYASYRNYKNALRHDFSKRCGYCDSDDKFCGYQRGFQIDHFRPQKLFPKLIHTYSNLVYSCPFCNRSKWDKWKVTDGFIDPCSPNYRSLFVRDGCGQIHPIDTDQARFIYSELNLGLKRHAIIWCISELEEAQSTISKVIKSEEAAGRTDIGSLKEYFTLGETIKKYLQYFDQT